MLYLVLLVVGVALILRDGKLKKPFLKYFGWISLGLVLFYLIIDPFQFTHIGNVIGIVFLAFLVAILTTFVRKWFAPKDKQKFI
ncbi:MAG: hypothetical protein Q8Q92_00085 [bacterium]|nr:hypothetical protein [bacterium]